MRLRDRIKDRRIKRKERRGARQGTRQDARSLPARPTSAEMPPTTNVRPPASNMKVDNKVNKSAPSVNRKTTPPTKTNVPKRPRVTGMDGRNVSTDSPTAGKRTLANVTREQMTGVGLDPNKKSDLTKYLNKFDELKRRPRKSDFKKVGTGKLVNKIKEKRADKKLDPKTIARRDRYYGGGMMKAKGKAGGGMMKAKGMKAGGKTKFPDLTGDGEVTRKDILKGRGVRGMKTGGMMKTKGATAGGKMKSKGYKKGGKVNKKQKVRGAGIARKGVRPAKMY